MGKIDRAAIQARREQKHQESQQPKTEEKTAVIDEVTHREPEEKPREKAAETEAELTIKRQAEELARMKKQLEEAAKNATTAGGALYPLRAPTRLPDGTAAKEYPLKVDLENAKYLDENTKGSWNIHINYLVREGRKAIKKRQQTAPIDTSEGFQYH